MDRNQLKTYLAGFFDGEGYVGITSTGNGFYTLRVIVGQKHPTVLLEIQKHYQGTITERLDKRSGVTYHVWECKAKLAEVFLRDIQPFSIEKSQQINLALQYRDGLPARDSRNKDRSEQVKQWAIKFKNSIQSINSPMGFGRAKEGTVYR